ncbi:unnamed protein product [Spirodela intermedia]|uniref:Uncharacterized protein n=2 Tax=Spirodela intermedia TaxID=51605 RepID=A0A7I8L2R6_SPIIN|nr:unnamed protein product [Spirodela intermedia]CAA6666756.1 unnamed protein product [Spirodela intermedia]CAA7403555.1 unnamed protein product [Spirodela intermedia]
MLRTERRPVIGNLENIPVVRMADFIAAGDQVGCKDLRSATIPDTCGAAIDVPSLKPYESPAAARMLTPGAVMSGCIGVKYFRQRTSNRTLRGKT